MRSEEVMSDQQDDFEARWAKLRETLDNLPEPTARPCVECPWLRTSRPGHLGPHSADEWCEIAHSDGPIACHMTIDHNDQDWSELRQCAGSAIFRTNICKQPRHPKVAVSDSPDTTAVFTWDDEFKAHHDREGET